MEAELAPEEAERAAKEAWTRIRGPRPQSEGLGEATVFGGWTWTAPRSFREALASDPQGSIARIVSGAPELPFIDRSTGELSVVGFAELFATVGVDPVVSMACARVVVEMHSAESFYAPVWRALGRKDALDFETLAAEIQAGQLDAGPEA